MSLYTGVACTTTPGYTDTGLVNGTTYDYVVSSAFTGGPNGISSIPRPSFFGIPFERGEGVGDAHDGAQVAGIAQVTAGWVTMNFDLSAYSGDILLAFRYVTDWAGPEALRDLRVRFTANVFDGDAVVNAVRRKSRGAGACAAARAVINVGDVRNHGRGAGIRPRGDAVRNHGL